MSTITREWLQQAINDYESVRDEIPFGLDDYQGNILAALRIALASLEAEAVEVTFAMAMDFHHALNDGGIGNDDIEEIMIGLRAAFANITAPPAPVSVPAAMEMDDDFDSAFEHGKAVGWNAYRAAMLQGAKPVTTAYKLRDAVETIRNSGIVIDADKIFAERDALNSPVIPSGWVMVPVEPTEDMVSSGIAAHYERSQIQIHDRPAPGPMECAYVAMLAAAPQQEVK